MASFARLLQEAVQTAVTDIPGSIVSAAVVLVINITCAGIIFPGSQFADGVVICLMTSAAGTALSIPIGKDRPLKYLMVSDTFMASLFTVASSSIRAGTPNYFGTLVATMMFSSLINALCYIGLGVAKVGKLVELMPSPVISGYLVSMGFAQLSSAAKLISGVPLTDPASLAHSPLLPSFLVALGLGSTVYVLQRKTTGLVNVLVMPTFLGLSITTFAVLRLLLPAAALSGASFEVPASVDLLKTIERLDLSNIDWKLAFTSAVPISVTSMVPNTFGRLLTYSSLESRCDVQLDYNVELIASGVMNLAAVPAAMTPAVSFSGMLLSHMLGARGRLPQVVGILTSGYLLFIGMGLVEALPKMMSASLLVTLGCSFLVSELTDAIQCLKKQEFALVLVHLAVTIYFGMLYAVLSGLLFSMLIFIVDYVSHSGVVQSATSELKRSTVVRTNEEWDFLAEHGASTLIIHLQGMAFFGSASQVIDVMRAHRLALTSEGRELRNIIIDCELCPMIDTSAVSALFLARRICKEARLIFTAANPEVRSMIEKRRIDFLYFETLDDALEACETDLLKLYAITRALFQRTGSMSAIERSPSASSNIFGLFRQMSLKRTGTNSLFQAPGAAAKVGLESKSDLTEPMIIGRKASGDRWHKAVHLHRIKSEDLVGSSTADRVGGIAVYPAEECKAHALANPEGHRRLIERFVQGVEAVHGIRELSPIIDYCDVVVCMPDSVIYDESDTLRAGPSAVAQGDQYLYFLDKGSVTVSLAVDTTSDAASKHRIGKVGPGAVLSLRSFMMSGGTPGSHSPLPTMAVADTECQLLRLRADRYASIEKADPALACRLIRLLLQVTQARLAEAEQIAISSRSRRNLVEKIPRQTSPSDIATYAPPKLP